MAGMALLLVSAFRKQPPAGRHGNRGNTMSLFIPLILLALGTIEMALKDLVGLPAPHWVQDAVAVACVVLSLISLLLYMGLKLKETGTRGRP